MCFWGCIMDELTHALFEEVLTMEQSATYQAILRRGRAAEARRVLQIQGEAKFGPLDGALCTAFETSTTLPSSKNFACGS